MAEWLDGDGGAVDRSDAGEMATILRLFEAGGDELLTAEEADALQSEMGADFGTEDPCDCNANLAQWIPEGKLATLGQAVHEWVADDLKSRAAWDEREALGIQMLGFTRVTAGGAQFEGASRAVDPSLIKAVTQFQARAMAELWPSGGPVKAVVVGDITPEREAQAERVAGFMNYQYEREMPGAFEEHDRLLWRLPMSGSVFKKLYFDPLENTVVSRCVESKDFFVPYSAADLRTAPRFTHEARVVRNDLLKLQVAGMYLDLDLDAPQSEGTDQSSLDVVRDDAEGRSPTESASENPAEFDQRDVLYECYCQLDLRDYEYTDPLASDGYGDPYVVTVHRDTQRVLAVRRNWRKEDPKRRRRLFFTHYRFCPGLGFYGFGYFQLAGAFHAAQTGALRALLDAATLANLKGGFKSRDLRLHGNKSAQVKMGEWVDVDATAEEVAKGFYTLPYDEPSPTLFRMLEWMSQEMASLVSTTESMIGEDAKAMQVGTILARIDQQLVVFSGVHRRCHAAQKTEFEILADLNSEYLPGEYPYDVPGESRAVFQADFDERVDVLPVSDPNTYSKTQRVALAQAVFETATQSPDLIDRRTALRRWLEAMRVDQIDELMPQPDEVPRREPVGEGMALLMGQPVRALPDQDHAAHLAVHHAWWAGVPEERRELLAPAYMAHEAEHLAQWYRLEMMRLAGVELPGPDETLDPEIDALLAQAVAQAAQQYGAVPMPGAGPADAPEAAQDPRTDADNVRALADIRRKDALAEADIRRKDREAAAATERELANQIAADLMEGAKVHQSVRASERGVDQNAAAGLADVAARFGSGPFA
jgi:hypothetical protein